jgi:hypothetical protein
MALPQTTYSNTPAIGVPGTLLRSPRVVDKRIANGAIGPGVYVVVSGDDCAVPSAIPTPGTRGGVTIKNEASVDGAYADNEVVDILCEGTICVDVEAAVTRDGRAFARFVVGASAEPKGGFRADAGLGATSGTVGGKTFTMVTAENAGVYSVTLDGIEFSIIADGSATTTEIATALAARIDAHANYVATNPTVTTVLVVGATATAEIVVDAYDSRMTVADNAAAFVVPGAFYRTTTSGVCELELTAQ